MRFIPIVRFLLLLCARVDRDWWFRSEIQFRLVVSEFPYFEFFRKYGEKQIWRQTPAIFRFVYAMMADVLRVWTFALFTFGEFQAAFGIFSPDVNINSTNIDNICINTLRCEASSSFRGRIDYLNGIFGVNLIRLRRLENKNNDVNFA